MKGELTNLVKNLVKIFHTQDKDSEYRINLHNFSQGMADSPGQKGGKSILLSGLGKRYHLYDESQSELER